VFQASSQRRANGGYCCPMERIARIGMDTSKHLFQLHGVDAEENVILRRQVRRNQMVTFFQKLPSTLVGRRPAVARLRTSLMTGGPRMSLFAV
jgi:hypothetical protein